MADVQARPSGRGAHLVITVHGIRTYGEWQERLEDMLKVAEPGICVRNYHYGYFSIFAFLTPFLRWVATMRFRAWFRSRLSEFPDRRRVDMVAHSFGTHMAAWTLYSMRHVPNLRIHTVILAGSVLKPGFRWEKLLVPEGIVGRVINDCGILDCVLVLNQLCVLFTGMAGRVGFTGGTFERYRNRYYWLGHSGYFQRGTRKTYDKFMCTRWLPLLTTEDVVPKYDKRRPLTCRRGALEWMLENIGPVKTTAWTILLLIPIVLFGWLWRRAEDARKATAMALAEARVNLYHQSIAQADREIGKNELSFAKEILNRCPRDLRAFEWRYLRHRATTSAQDFECEAIGTLRDLAVSPDGRVAALATSRGPILLWSLTENGEIATLAGHTAGVNRIRFAPNGLRLVSGSDDRTTRIWDTKLGRESRAFVGHAGPVRGVAFSPDGRRVASVGGPEGQPGDLKVWDGTTGEEIHTIQAHQAEAWDVAFDRNGNRLATVGLDDRVKIWDAETWQPVLALEDRGSSLAFSPVSALLAVASSPRGGLDGFVTVWDTTTGQEVFRLRGHRLPLRRVLFSPDGRRIVSGGMDKTVRVWDTATGTHLLALTGHKQWIQTLGFSGDGTRLVSGGSLVNVELKIWDAPNDPEVFSFSQNAGSVSGVAFSPDGLRLAAGFWEIRVQENGTSKDTGQVKVWDTMTGKEILSLAEDSGRVSDVAFNSDGKRIAAATGVSYDAADFNNPKPGHVKVWDAFTGEELLQFPGQETVAYCSNGCVASAGLANTIFLGKARTGESLAFLWGHDELVNTVVFSHKGRRLASAANDKTVMVWDMRTKQQICAFKGHAGIPRSVAFSADDCIVASASGDYQTKDGKCVPIQGEIRLWDATTGVETVKIGTGTGPVEDLVFSPDGEWLVSVGTDYSGLGEVQVWDPKSGQRIAVLNGHANTVRCVACSADGTTLATGDIGGVVKVWDTTYVKLDR